MNKLGKTIVIGAGHNGLVTAGYLARAGEDVTVLESRHVVGGAAVTEEFMPGFQSSMASFVVGLLRPEIIADLELEQNGLELYAADEAISCTIFEDGSNFFMWRNLDRTLKDIKQKFGAEDLQGFMQFGMDMQFVAEIMGPHIMAPPPSVSEFVGAFERAGQMALFERFITGSVRDLCDFYFKSEALKAHFIFPGLVSMYGGPSTPGTAYLLAHHSVGEFMGQFGLWGYARGGMGSITKALAKSAEAHGVEIRTSTPVRQIVTRGGKVTGVELTTGETIEAERVISNADPRRTLFDLIGVQNLPKDFVKEIEEYDVRGTMARVYIATEELPAFIGFDSTKPGVEHEGHLFLGPNTDLFEDGWDAQRRGRIPDDFAVEALIDSVRDNSFAPPGKHVLTLGVQQLPFTLKGSDRDAEKDRFTQRVVDKFVQYAPNLKDKVIGAECRTPLDWERDYNLTGGNIYHGAMTMGRIMGARPGALRNGYAAPVDGLYLCGAGTHPGGGVMGASGFNAAMAVLTDIGVATPRPWRVEDHPPANGASRSLSAVAFDNPFMRSVMAKVATSPLSRPLGKLMTRAKAQR